MYKVVICDVIVNMKLLRNSGHFEVGGSGHVLGSTSAPGFYGTAELSCQGLPNVLCSLSSIGALERLMFFMKQCRVETVIW